MHGRHGYGPTSTSSCLRYSQHCFFLETGASGNALNREEVRRSESSIFNHLYIFPTAGLLGFNLWGWDLEPWDPGTLGPWNLETLELWNPGTLEPWNPGTLELWNFETSGTLKFLDF